MDIILCPRCAGTGFFDGVCYHCHGEGREEKCEIDEEGQAILAVIEVLEPELVAAMYDDETIRIINMDWDDGKYSWYHNALHTALHCVLLGIPESAWEDFAIAGEDPDHDNFFGVRKAKKPRRPGRKALWKDKRQPVVIMPEGCYYP